MTRSLLFCGAVAGPLYVLASAIQVLFRDGFEIMKHPVSLLANGPFGWIQVLNFTVTGALVVAAAVGLHRALDPGPGDFWGPVFVGVFGLGMIASGIFVADPANGFPPGTPLGNPEQGTFSGMMHFTVGGIAFLSFVAACAVFGRRFTVKSEPLLAAASWFAGGLYLLAFAVVAAAAGSATGNVLLTLAVVCGWAWLAVLVLKIEGDFTRFPSFLSPAARV